MDCDHITTKITLNGRFCNRCGEELPEAPSFTAEDWAAAQKHAAKLLQGREQRAFNHKACVRDEQNRKHFGDGSWGDGRVIPHLDPRDPDRRVTNEKQMREVYDKNGICMDTAEVRDEAKFNARQAEVRRKNRKPGWDKKQPGAKLVKSEE